MTWLEFVSKIIEALAWPASAIAIVIILRNPVSFLIRSLGKIKYKDLEMDFAGLRELAGNIILPPLPPSVISQSNEMRFYSSFKDQILDTVSKSPAGATLLAWTAIESTLSSAVARLCISPDEPSSRSVQHNIQCLRRSSDLPIYVFQVVDRLRILRNKIAHDYNTAQQISEDDALSYAESAIRVIESINNAKYIAQQIKSADPAQAPGR